MTIESKLDKKIQSIAQLIKDIPERIEITQEEYTKLLNENMKTKDKFLKIKDNQVYFRNIKLIVK